MGALDFLYTKKPTNNIQAERERADAATRRCQELRAENARLKHNVKALREELETLRRCLAAKPPGG